MSWRPIILHFTTLSPPTCPTLLREDRKPQNYSGNNFRHARKHQTFREMTFAMRGNSKPFGKRLSPCAEMPNLSGNDFRHARKSQTTRETTFAKRGNHKPLGKRLSPSAETPNHSAATYSIIISHALISGRVDWRCFMFLSWYAPVSTLQECAPMQHK